MEIFTVKNVKIALVDEGICVNKTQYEGDAVCGDKCDTPLN